MAGRRGPRWRHRPSGWGCRSPPSSLALNNRPGSRLSQDAVARAVRTASRDLKYRPNPAAPTLPFLQPGRRDSPLIISDEVTVTRFASAMIRGILDVGSEQERVVLIAETGGHPMQLERALDSMVDRQVDALIFGSLAARLIDFPPLPGRIPTVTVELSQRRGPSVRLPERGGRRICGCQASPGCRNGDTLGIIGNTLGTTRDPGSR